MSPSTEEREFAVGYHKCDSCGFTARHMIWEFPFLPYNLLRSDPIELANGVKIYMEDGELIIESPEEGTWALCSTYVPGGKNFWWICRPFAVNAEDPCDVDYMKEIST